MLFFKYRRGRFTFQRVLFAVSSWHSVERLNSMYRHVKALCKLAAPRATQLHTSKCVRVRKSE